LKQLGDGGEFRGFSTRNRFSDEENRGRENTATAVYKAVALPLSYVGNVADYTKAF
jgi:hypothetical protein